MTSTFFGLDLTVGASNSPRAFKYNSLCSVEPLGSAVSTGITANNNADILGPKILQVSSSTYLGFFMDGLYLLTDPATTWTKIFNITDINTAIGPGLLYTFYNAREVLTYTAIYSNTSNRPVFVRSTDLINWTSVTTTAVSTSMPPASPIMQVGRYLVMLFTGTSGAALAVYDSILNTWATAGALGYGASCTMYNGRPHFLYLGGGGVVRDLYRMNKVNPVTSTVPVVSFNATTGANGGHLSCLFVKGDYLYAIFWRDAITCYRFDSDYNIVDLTSNVLPSMFNVNTSRWKVLVDSQTNPTDPIVYLVYTTSNVGDVVSSFPVGQTIWRWVDDATPLEFVGVGGSSTTCLSVGTYSQGVSFTAPGSRRIILNRTYAQPEYLAIEFKLQGIEGESVDVEAYIGDELASNPLTQAELLNPSAGSMSGNTITNIVLDNSETYTVSWNYKNQGFEPQDYYKLVLRVIPS